MQQLIQMRGVNPFTVEGYSASLSLDTRQKTVRRQQFADWTLSKKDIVGQ